VTSFAEPGLGHRNLQPGRPRNDCRPHPVYPARTFARPLQGTRLSWLVGRVQAPGRRNRTGTTFLRGTLRPQTMASAQPCDVAEVSGWGDCRSGLPFSTGTSVTPSARGGRLRPRRPASAPSIGPPMFRISRDGQEPVVDVAQVEEVEPAIRSSEPGRYHIDQINREPLPSGHTSRRWGVGIKSPDGSATIVPDPWER
jgi:hypothetical protein